MSAPRPRVLIVDGHSMIFQWPELRALHARNGATARDQLVRALTRHQDNAGIHVIAVFDGKGAKASQDEEQIGIQVFYSKSGQTADSIIERIVDDGDFLEIQPLFAPNIVIGFARVEGHSVGIIANQPNAMAGTLNIDAGEKAARFVRFCDAFSIPILTLVDVPGYLPGTDQEWTGVIRRGAKLLYAYAEATVPLVTVITRKAYGGAYIVMGSKQLGADINLAWPTAEIAVMGGQGAVNILYRSEIKKAEESGEDVAAVRTKLANEYLYNVASPFLAAERGELDGIIEPAATRIGVIKSLRALRAKRATQPPKKHGNIPL